MITCLAKRNEVGEDEVIGRNRRRFGGRYI